MLDMKPYVFIGILKELQTEKLSPHQVLNTQTADRGHVSNFDPLPCQTHLPAITFSHIMFSPVDSPVFFACIR